MLRALVFGILDANRVRVLDHAGVTLSYDKEKQAYRREAIDTKKVPAQAYSPSMMVGYKKVFELTKGGKAICDGTFQECCLAAAKIIDKITSEGNT